MMLVGPIHRREGSAVNILFWIAFGLVAGIIAKLLLPGRDPGGCIITMLLGVAGAFVGGFLYTALTDRPFAAEFDLGSMAVAVIGSIIVLLLYRAIVGRRA
jgi:uncharacterized membrane protein YeaQ/YmgE (transglycosylase-associated protein family)